MPIRFIVILTLAGIFLSGGRLFGDDEEYLVDPNGESAPQAIQDLELTFRLNSYDINAPTILFTADGTLGFVNYIKSESQSEQGYVLVFKPAEADPAQRIVTAIPVGQFPALMYFNPAQTEMSVVNLGNFGSTFNTFCTISVIQIASQSVIATIAAPEARFGLGSNVLFSSDGGVAYISSTYTDEILRLNTSSYQVVDKLKLPAEFPYYYASVAPSCLTLSHDGTFICSTNTFNETVSIISTSSFTELRRVILRDVPYNATRHYANLTFRNNVLLSEDDTLGLVGSAGLGSASFDPGVVFIPDQVFLFDPQTGVKIKNDDGQDIFLPVEDNPTTLTLDPTGRYLVVAIASYDKVDSTGAEFYGYPAMHMFTWPELQLFKIQQFRSPEYNLTRTGAFGFTPDGAGNYDPVFPSFSTFSTYDSDVPNEKLVRVSGSYLDSTTGLGALGDGENRFMPVTLSPVPGSSNFAVAYFLTGTVAIVPPPEAPNFSDAFSVFIEEGRFSSILMLNPWNESVNYFVQAIQTNNTNDNNEDDDWAGLPFFWLDENNNAYVIDPYEIVLEPGQQLVSMFQGLVPGYDKVENQHGFLKAGHPERPIVGLTYNGHYSDEGVLTRGDYLQAGHEMYQDAIFPYLFSVGNNVTVLHYTNPYFNQMRVQRLKYGLV